MKIQLSRQSRKEFKKWKKANGQLKKRNLKAMEFNQKNPDKKQMNYESELEPPMVVKVYLPVNALIKNSMLGDMFSRIVLKHSAGFQVYNTHSCNITNCEHHNIQSYPTWFTLLGPIFNWEEGESGTRQSLSQLNGLLEGTTTPCRDTRCRGMQTHRALTVLEENWALFFDLTDLNEEQMMQAKGDILMGNLPKTLEVKTHKSGEN